MRHLYSVSNISSCSIALAISLVASGCSMGIPASSVQVVATAHQAGRAMGGQQPVSGAVVTLWKAGKTTSYGQGAVSLYSTQTDAAGNFNLTGGYTCGAGDQLYITAYGGDPGGGPNSANGLAAALGDCTVVQATPFIVINEATTVATIFALQQFAKVTYGTSGLATVMAGGLPLNIGAPASNVVGLTNAFLTVNNLAPATSAPTIPQSYSRSATINGTSTTMVVTPPYAKIATLANILASCVNSNDAGSANSSICSTLFTSVKPASQASLPADTIQAALDMAINSGNVGSASAPPYSLSSSNPPFQPSLTAPPADWQLGLSFTSSTLVDPTGSPAYFLYGPSGVQVDSAGNIYILNYAGAGGSTAPYNNSVVEFSPIGTPIGLYLNTSAASIQYPRSMVLDVNNHIFVGDAYYTQVTEYVSSSTIAKFTVPGNPAQLIGDSGGNILASSSNGNVYKITPGVTTATLVTTLPTTTSSFLALDGNLNLWLTGNATSSTAGNQYVAYVPCTPGSGAVCTGTSTNTYPSTPTKFTSFPTLNGNPGVPIGVGIDSNNNALIALTTYAGTFGFGCDFSLNATSVATSITPVCSANLAGGLNNPQESRTDGANTLWSTDLATSTTTFAVSGLNYSGGNFTPVTGSKGLADVTLQSRYMEIDQSGNLWLTYLNPSTSGTITYVVSEVVGAAAPVYAPLANAIKNGSLGRSPQ